MAIGRKSRELYQPSIDENGAFVGGERDYYGRLSIIESIVNFKGARVLDLGCSAGFFSFSIAKKAEYVLAVDADDYILKKNRATKERLGVDNIDFLNAEITPEFLCTMPQFDVVLFLSVFHHLMASSGTYEWTENTEKKRAVEVLDILRTIARTLVFEVGRPDEEFAWCKEINKELGEPRCWVPKKVFGDDFNHVMVLSGSAYNSWPFNKLPAMRKMIPANRYGKKILRLLNVDIRDFREIYIGEK